MYEHENTGPIKIEMANARCKAGIFVSSQSEEEESNVETTFGSTEGAAILLLCEGYSAIWSSR